MEPKDAVLLGIAVVVLCMPVLAITVRISLKPIVDALVRLRELDPTAPAAGSDRRMPQLETGVRQLRGTVAELEATVEFQQKLLTAGAASAPDPVTARA